MTNAERYKTEKERAEAFNNFCDKNDSCSTCPCYGNRMKWECAFYWLDLEAEEEEEEEQLPCPFCGGNVKYEITVMEHILKCRNCGYMNTVKTATDKSVEETKRHDKQLKEELIAAHNRVARAAKETTND